MKSPVSVLHCKRLQFLFLIPLLKKFRIYLFQNFFHHPARAHALDDVDIGVGIAGIHVVQAGTAAVSAGAAGGVVLVGGDGAGHVDLNSGNLAVAADHVHGLNGKNKQTRI